MAGLDRVQYGSSRDKIAGIGQVGLGSRQVNTHTHTHTLCRAEARLCVCVCVCASVTYVHYLSVYATGRL